MLFTVYNGETIALCLAFPDWSQQVSLEINLPFNQVVPGLSHQEQRENLARSSRYTMQYQVGFPAGEDTRTDAVYTNQLRLWLQKLKGELVAVPLWTDGVETFGAIAGQVGIFKTADMPAQYGAEWIIISDDAQTYEIVTVNAITAGEITLGAGCALDWADGTMMFPLLFGNVSDRPKFNSDTDEILSGQITFEENSTFARRLNPYLPNAIPVVGANVPDFATKPLWTIQPDESQTVMVDTTELDLIYAQIGFGRQKQQDVKAQPVRRSLQLQFYQSNRTEIAQMVSFFVDRAGPVKSFMMPTFQGNLRLAQDTPEAPATRVDIEPDPNFAEAFTELRAGVPLVAFVDVEEGGGVEAAQIDAMPSNSQLTMHANIGAHSMATCKLSNLILSRFIEPKLTLAYDSDGLASTSLRVLELSEEYVDVQPDPPELAYAFKFTEVIQATQAVIQTWLFTSYETQLNLASGNAQWDGAYVPGPYDVGDIEQATDMSEEKMDVTSFDFSLTTNPLRKIMDYALEGILHLDVLEVDVNNLAAAPTLYFAGDLASLQPQGKQWTATFRVLGQFFARQVGRFYFQRTCNVHIYSQKCGVVMADFLTDGTISAIAPDVPYVDVAQIAGHANPAALATNYLAPTGFFQTGAGATFEQRTITQSQTVAGKLRVWFSQPLNKAVIGQTINMYPGCDGSVGNCISPFNNLINMRAQPYIPVKNPSANAAATEQATGGKK